MQRAKNACVAATLGIALIAAFAMAKSAVAHTVVVQRIAGATTAAPGGGTFDSYSRASLGDNFVAFGASTTAFNSGIYTYDGSSIGLVVDQNSPIPGGTGNFGNTSLSFVGEAVSGNAIIFDTFIAGGPTDGLYASHSGVITNIADTSTPIPGGGGNFHGFSDGAADGSNVAFEANASVSASVPNGIFKRIGGVIGTVADENTAIPGGTGNFTNFTAPSLDGDRVAFGGLGNSNQRGVYTDAGAGLSVVIDMSSPVPGSTGSFTNIGVPSFDSGNVVFSGSVNATNFSAIYLTDDFGATFQTVASTDMPVPNGAGNFLAVESGLTHAGNVAFRGTDSDLTRGIYALYDGQLIEVVDSLTLLDGKLPNSLSLHSFRDNRFVFEAQFIEGERDVSRALYLATVTIDGDFNFDGSVDAADYVVWRKALGTQYTQDDYDAWAANYGLAAQAAGRFAESHSAPVPEPSLLYAASLAAGVAFLRRRR